MPQRRSILSLSSLQQRASDAKQQAQQNETALADGRQQVEEAKRGRDENQAQIDRLQRRLESEQERRSEAERRVEELKKGQASPPQEANPAPSQSPSVVALGRYRNFSAVLGYAPANDELFKLMCQAVTVLVGALPSPRDERYSALLTHERMADMQGRIAMHRP